MEQQADYITEALELIGISEPKQIIQEVSGFVPVFEALLEKYDDHITALVFGRRWQYCRMKDGACTASLERIANDLKLSAATVMRHTQKLVDDGYLIDLTPDARNVPHVYMDAGLVIMKSQLSASVSQGNTSISQRKATVSQSQLIKDSIRQDKQTTTTAPNVFNLYESNIGPLTPIIADSLQDLEKTYSAEWLARAIQEAAASNVRKLKYIEGVLKGYKERGNPDTPRETKSYGKAQAKPAKPIQQLSKEEVERLQNSVDWSVN